MGPDCHGQAGAPREEELSSWNQAVQGSEAFFQTGSKSRTCQHMWTDHHKWTTIRYGTAEPEAS